MLDDLRQAIRSLRKQPGFAAVAILTLAFGIGVNVTIFSLVSGLFLQPLKVKDSDRLVMVMQRGEIINVPYGYSFPDYLDIRKSVSSLTEMAAFMPTAVHLSAKGQTPERTWVEVVSPNYFALAQVSPAFGELLKPGKDEARGGAPTAVLAYRYWQRRFGGNPVDRRPADHPQRPLVHRRRHRARVVHRAVVGDGRERVGAVGRHGRADAPR